MSDILSNGNIIANRANTARTEDTPVIPVQHIDAAGTVGGVTLNTALDKTNDSITAYPKGINLSVISKTTAVTIGGGVANDTKLFAIRILAALTGTCAITGFADSDGTAQTITIPAASVGEFRFHGAKNSAGALTVTCSNAGDDNLVCVLWDVNTDAS